MLYSASCAGLSELRGRLNVNLNIRIYEKNLFER